MKEVGDEDFESFLEFINKTTKQTDAAAFLQQHGVKLKSESSPSINTESMFSNENIEDLEESVNKMLLEYKKKLFNDESDMHLEANSEELDNLAIAVGNDLCSGEEKPLPLYFRDKTSFLHEYNVPDPYFPPKGSDEPSTHLAGLHYLESALKRCQFGSEDIKTDLFTPQASKKEEKDKEPCTVESLANILASVDEELQEERRRKLNSNEVEESQMVPVTCADHTFEPSADNEAKPTPEALCGTSSASDTIKEDAPKKRKKKKKNKYEPKKIDIDWCDPRTDPQFLNEIAEMMQCDSFEPAPSLFQIPREIDDLTEDFDPPLLPRHIVRMLKSAKKNDFADWEYSIKLEKGEFSGSDSEVEELKKDFDDIEKEIDSTKENVQEDFINSQVEAPVDVSEFMKLIIPPVMEDIIAVRDDMGNIISYESVRRRDEHLSKEYERVYLGLESETEDEEEKEDNEVHDGEEAEIIWEKDYIKGSDFADLDHNNFMDGQLKEDLEKIKSFLTCHLNETEEKFDPELEEQMSKVDKILDMMGVPKAGEIEGGSSPREIMKEEVKKLEHVFEAHKGQICPPGNLEVEITSEDDDDVYFKNLNMVIRNDGEDEVAIERPASLKMNFNLKQDFAEAENVEISSTLPSNLSPSQFSLPLPSLFDADKISKKEEIGEPKSKRVPDIFACSDSSDDENMPISSESVESHLDKEFVHEYFKRGGTIEGLKESDNEDEENLELESIESFSKKYFTFPFASKHAGKFDFVRARRIIAQHFPNLRDEAFADLKKLSLQLDISEDSSSDSSDYNEKLIYKSDPFEFEEFTKKPTNSCPSCAEDESWLTADEDEYELKPMVFPKQTLEELINNGKHQKKRKKKKSKARDHSSDSEKEIESNLQNKNFLWSPIDKFDKPSYENALGALEKVHTILKPPQRFKKPKGMKAWLKGEHNPSKETLQSWKKSFVDHYGDVSILDKVITPDKQKKYEAFLERIDESRRLNDTEESNFILIFKKILEEQKRERERKEKAEEIISSSDFYSHSAISSVEVKEEKPVTQDSTGNEKCDLLEDKSDKISLRKSPPPDDKSSIPQDVPEDLVAEPPKTPVIRLREVKSLSKKEEWAEELNCTVNNELKVTLAMNFPFKLDGFQREAIQALEDGYNVFVSAHTSAGKTVVAEYAIAMSKRNRSKAVYTSPVKALSNQKYADFKRIFGSVGLITGDIQLNENAECLIMTTEILRSMLYNSSEKIRDLEFVVFDEVHYINDPERGHVWEEVLILLPSQVQIVMLSATVPNTLEFANWVGRTKQRKVMVCATHHRPVPLNHYLYTGTGGPSPGNTYLVKCGDGSFIEDQYLKAQEVMKALQETERRNKKKQQMKRMEEEREWKKKGFAGKPPIPPGEDYQSKMYKKDQTMWIALINFLVKKDWLPAVCFVFSRKKCDAFAEMLYTVDLTTKSEKSFIHRFIKSQVEKLDEVDQDLPQIQVMKRQLDKGIGVHHSGILPVMKEIVEVLFQEGKVKLLFATETFAMGVNMPARTVVFHAVKKFDGNETRLLQPAEYVQMAGRAGRRGKDSAGNVIILMRPNEIIPRPELETLLYGNPCKLISKFRLSYRMILNTLTVSGMLTVQNMMERSFCENHGQMKRKFLEKELVEAEVIEKSSKKNMCSAVDDMVVDILSKFYDHAIYFVEEWLSLRLYMVCQSRIFKDLSPGRILKISMGSLIQRTGLLIESEVFPDNPSRNTYKVMVMDQNSEFERVIAPDGHDMDQKELETWYRIIELMANLPHELSILSGPNDYSIHSVKIHNIMGVFKENLKLPKNIFEEFLKFLQKKSQFSRMKTCDAGDTIAMHLYGYTGKYTTIDERQITYDNFDLSCRVIRMWSILDEIKMKPVSADSPLVMKAFRRVFRWKQALRKVQMLRHDLSAENMSLYPDFRSKMELLKEKGYISSTEQVQMKGYMAARIGKYELIVCEMLVDNVLLDLSPEEVAALLSFLVYQSSAEDPPLDKSLPSGLESAIIKCKKIMSEVQELEKKYDIRDYEGSEISKLKFGLVPVMYAWAKQEPLKNIMDMPVEFDFQEGLLVRWIQQLLETLKEVEAAARLMGDPGVPARLQAAGQSIKRGIVFAPSLYTTMI